MQQWPKLILLLAAYSFAHATLPQATPPGQHAFHSNANDRLIGDVYDANGNTRTNGANVFFYDVENRLTNAAVGGTNITIIYDGDGNRVRKIVGTTTNTYLVDTRNPSGYAQVLEERVNGVLTRVYNYGLDLISQRDVAGGTTLYFGYDGLGSTRYLTTTNATVANVFAYDAYGTLIASNAAPQTDYLFAGEQRDANLGFYYLRARYLNTGTGRFWTRDSFEGFQSAPLSLHRYLYAQADPINRLDPNGNTDFIQTIMTSKVGMTVMTMGGPAIASAHRYASTTIRGAARAIEVAQRVVAIGGDIVAWEERVMRATQAGVQVIGRFKLDMVVKLPGRQVNTLIESKSVPWDLYTRHPDAWQNFLRAVETQARAFAQATQTQSGVAIGERAIYFTSRVPQGLERAAHQIYDALGNHYQIILWGEKMLDDFLIGGL